MLTKARHFWIKGMLDHALHDATMMALDLEAQPVAVAQCLGI